MICQPGPDQVAIDLVRSRARPQELRRLHLAAEEEGPDEVEVEVEVGGGGFVVVFLSCTGQVHGRPLQRTRFESKGRDDEK